MNTLQQLLRQGNDAKGLALLGAKRAERFVGTEWFDDFFGDTLNGTYRTAVTGGSVGIQSSVQGGVLRLETDGSVSGEDALVSLPTEQFEVARNPIMEVAVNLTDRVQMVMIMGMTSSTAKPDTLDTATGFQSAFFLLAAGASATTLLVRTIDRTTGGNTDTEVTLATGTLYILRLELSTANVKWFVMDSDRTVLASGTITSDWPPPAANDTLNPYMGIESREADVKIVDVDYLYVSQDR